MNWYFTFGSDPQYPYGRDDYVLVHASSNGEARRKFKARYPSRQGSSLINCAFVYGEDEWEKHCKRFYPGVRPIDVID